MRIGSQKPAPIYFYGKIKLFLNGTPLISGDFETVHKAGISIQGQSIPEFEVEEDDWEDHLIEEEH